VGEVAHAEGSPEDGPNPVVESFGAAIARPAHEIVRDLVHSVPQGLDEFFHRLQSQLTGLDAPRFQARPACCGRDHRAVLGNQKGTQLNSANELRPLCLPPGTTAIGSLMWS